MAAATVKKMLVDAFWTPFQRNPLLVGTLLGLLLLIGGVLIRSFFPQKDHPIIGALGLAIVSAGTAVLVSGVFTAIVKSSQFSEIFRDHVMQALYSPSKVHTTEQSQQNWTNLTKSMLDRTLDSEAGKVTKRIYETFLNTDLELSHTYHDVRVSYEITVAADGNAKIINTLKTTLKVPVGVESPKFRQWLSVQGDKQLTYLRIGDQEIDVASAVSSEDKVVGGELLLEYPLAGHIGEGRTVEVERTFEINQHLPTEPFVTVVIEKYVFGLEVRVKVTPGYQITRIRSGSGVDRDKMSTEGHGFSRWVVAASKSLLWPGSGFTLIFTKQ